MKNQLGAGRDDLLQALDAIIDPFTGQGLVAAGRVLALDIADGVVRLTLEAPPGRAQALADARGAAERLLRDQKGVKQVLVAVTAQAAPGAGQAAREEAARLRKGEPAPPPRLAQPASRQAEGVPGVAHILAVSSAKGGVGKSTIAANLAVALARAGQRVGLLDADVYGPSLPTLLGLADAKPEMQPGGRLAPLQAFGLKAMSIGFVVDIDAPLIWRGPMATSAVRQLLDDVEWGPLDVLVIDMPPGTGDVHLTLAQRLPLSGAVIVSTPQEMALADVRRGIAMFTRTHVPILGVIENMAWYEPPGGARLYPFGEGGARRIAEAAGLPVLAQLPLEPALRESADAGRPLAADAAHPLARAFDALAQGVLSGLARAQKPAPTIRFE